MQTLPNDLQTLILDRFPYDVTVVFTPCEFKCNYGKGILLVHHFEFHTDPRFKEFTETGYFSFFCYNEQVLYFDSIAEAARAVIMKKIRDKSPAAAIKIEKKQWIPTLF